MTKQTGKAKTTKKERHEKIRVLPLKHQEHGFEFVSNAYMLWLTETLKMYKQNLK